MLIIKFYCNVPFNLLFRENLLFTTHLRGQNKKNNKGIFCIETTQK